MGEEEGTRGVLTRSHYHTGGHGPGDGTEWRPRQKEVGEGGERVGLHPKREIP
jgi:hypothetical protein